MTERLIVGQLEFPGGAPIVGARVSARLYSGVDGTITYGTAGDRTMGAVATLTNNSGAWALGLEPNANITPSGTVWRISEEPPGGAGVSYYITVPDSVGPHDVTDLLADEPGALPSQALASHIATVNIHRVPVANVADFHTSGNDHTAAIDAARVYAAANGLPLYFPIGEWNYTSRTAIQMANNERWIGANMREAILNFPNHISGDVGVKPGDYCSIEHMAISGTQRTGTTGVELSNGNTRCHFMQVRFEDWGTGTRHDNTWVINYTDCWWRGCVDYGIDNGTLVLALTVAGGEMVGCSTAIRSEYALMHRFNGVTIEDGDYGYVSHSDYPKFAVSFAGCYFEAFEQAAITTGGRQNDSLKVDACFFSRCDTAIVLGGDSYQPAAATGERWGTHRAHITSNVFMGGFSDGVPMTPLTIGANAHETIVGPNAWHAQYGEGVTPYDPAVNDNGTDTIHSPIAYA